MRPILTPLAYTYKKPNAEVWVFNTDDLPISKANIADQQLITFGPQAIGGNHKHPRTEWFIALSPGVKLFWLDENNSLQEIDMYTSEQDILLIEVPPFVPHAVKNVTTDHKIHVVEFANAKMQDAEFVQVI